MTQVSKYVRLCFANLAFGAICIAALGEATTLFRELAWAIAQERVQQLQAMLGAMNQFIGAIYGDEASH